MKNLRGFYYLVLTALITVVMILIYAAVQQTYRTGLNDPQIQMATDISLKINQGRSIESYFAEDPTDITKSLSPFIVFYDAQGRPIRSNAFLDGKMPQVPPGVFETFTNDVEHRISWQPRRGVRMAMVIIKTNASPVQFVAAGRSMIEVEERIHQMSVMVFFAWMICVGIIVFSAVYSYFMRAKKILPKTT